MQQDQLDRGTARVTVADPQELFRKGVLALLERSDGIEVVGESATPAEVENTVCLRQPDVAVVDANLVDSADQRTMTRAMGTSPGTRFLLISAAEKPATVTRLFEAGAYGVITRNAQVDELITAINCLVGGGQYLHPSLGAQLARSPTADELTVREAEVARLIALGYTNLQVAKSTYVSVRTIETHRSHIMTRLRLRTRVDLVRWALDNRLIGPTPDAQ